MKSLRWLFIVAAIGLFVQATAFGQFQRGAFSIGLQAGAQHYSGDFNRSGIGPAGAIVGRYMIRPYLGLQLQTGYSELRDDVDVNAFFTNLLDTKINLMFMFYQNSLVAPYVFAGIGGMRYQAFDGNRENLLKNANGTEKKGWEELALFGLGVEAFLTPTWSFQFSGDYHYAFSDDLDGRIEKNNYDGFLNARVSLLYNFGGDQDSDGDGIFDRKDGAPHQAEDFDGFQDWDGIPDPDNDGDGIPDTADGAPNEPEDIDGFEDYDGIPDPDNDGDGIPDSLDQAPNQAEDFDGFEDEDGIPDKDNDGDGIPDERDGAPNLAEDIDGFEDSDGIPDYDNDGDSIPDSVDLAPNQAENFNGFEDEDGVPDGDPWMKTGERRILQGISFASGSATLTSASYQALNAVAEELQKERSIHLDIQGFTDDVGGEESNMRLSLLRANSVRAFLVSKGVEGNRIMATGFGESSPIAPNDTPEGRRANRRIELVRTK